MEQLGEALRSDTSKARKWLQLLEKAGFALPIGNQLELTEAGAFWLHPAQNYFALNYVNRLWNQARREPWPQEVTI